MASLAIPELLCFCYESKLSEDRTGHLSETGVNNLSSRSAAVTPLYSLFYYFSKFTNWKKEITIFCEVLKIF